jgi:ribonuclease G
VRWFRRKKREEEAPVAAAPSETAGTPAVAEPEPTEKKPRRRRGTRGGRGRKKKTAQPTPAPVEASEEEAPKPRRRRTPAPKAALPKVKKEILVSIEVGEQRVAVLEDGQVAEVYLERPGRRSIAGNIYKGVVDNVLPGMEASFVDIGLEKNGFLYVDEIVVPELEGKRHGRKIQELVQRGQEVLVQSVKDPMGTKGARLTTEISLPGRFLVFTPFGDGVGVSRRLDDAERDRLKALCKELELPEGGLIVRTAAEGASKEELAGDLALLQKLWATVKGRAERAEPPALVYQEAELPLRIIRDLFLRDFERVVVDHERTYRRIVGYLKRMSKDLAARVELDRGAEPLMARYGVDQEVKSTLKRRIDLPSGGYLVFDYAEAFTVIDVNTGRFVGSRGKTSGARLEDTITKNNLEAVKEVVRQLRLRDIGGIIVIDFIDMANPKNRQLVEEALNRELERDRTKTYVVEISPLGLVEMTRQNVTDGPREILTDRCPTCSGDGVVVSLETYAVDAERRLRALVAASKSEAFLVELNAQVAGILIGPGASRLDELEKETGRRFAVKTRPRVSPSHFTLLEEGPAEKIDPQAFPVSPGQELELMLEETHLHEDEDAIARLDGYVITVAGAGGSVGKKVKVRIEHAGRTSAHAVLAEPSPDGRPETEGAEEEAERPPPRERGREAAGERVEVERVYGAPRGRAGGSSEGRGRGPWLGGHRWGEG